VLTLNLQNNVEKIKISSNNIITYSKEEEKKNNKQNKNALKHLNKSCCFFFRIKSRVVGFAGMYISLIYL